MEKGLSLYEEHSPPEKGLRFSANWWKFYTVYKYDFELYHALKTDIANKPNLLLIALRLPEIASCAYFSYFLTIRTLRKTDEETVRNMCYVLDEEGQRQYLGDQPHIYRVNALKRLRQELTAYYEQGFLKPQVVYSDTSKEQEIIEDFGDYTYYEENYTSEYYIHGGTRYKGQAFTTKDIELNWVADADIKTQITAYVSVLRLCKKGTSLDEAVRKVKYERKEDDN